MLLLSTPGTRWGPRQCASSLGGAGQAATNGSSITHAVHAVVTNLDVGTLGVEGFNGGMAFLKSTNGLLDLGGVVGVAGLNGGEVHLGQGRLGDGKGAEAGGGGGRALVGEAEAPLAVQLGAAVSTSTPLVTAEAHHGTDVGGREGTVLDPGAETKLLDKSA